MSEGYEQVCSICHRSEREAGKMMRMPMNMCVCADCMDKIAGMIDDQMGNLNGANGAIDFDKLMSMYGAMRVQNDEKSNEDYSEKKGTNPDGGTQLKEDIINNDELNFSGEEGEKDKTEEEKKTGPKVNFINFADLPFMNLMGGGRTRVKRKDKEDYKPLLELDKIPAPHKIKAMLDEYVVGQEYAKKVMSVAVYNHYKRVATHTMNDIEIEKSNMLMLGPTGCGKTYLVKTLAKLLDVPLAITDATTLTEAGYIGDDIESVVSKLLSAADNDVDKAEQGIIYIDEIDKIAKKEDSKSRDVSGEAVQQGLLKLLEGADVEVPVGASSKNAMVPTTVVNTSNILFICGGAFPGLEDIIENRLKKTTSMGFGGEVKSKLDKDKNILQKVETEDIRKFGMIPEFVGRLPMVFALEGLDKDMMIRILKEPKNAILKQYQKLLELDEVKLEFNEEALEYIAEQALKKETGARALRSIIEEHMIDIMYEIPKDDNIGVVTITREYLEGKGAPLISPRG
ncbi:MAG: ATP-dependent Clp protease ATP-binding subunit ClpX [Lachnospiraceae bacterium]|nr:ATP-dependent Clp protease ATP-binding subunit ClpX [Lachnospiraceae bacterium]